MPLAVLPFANMGGDPEQDYFSDGISEDIITELSRWHMLAVRSRAASFRYRGVAVDVREVASELGVRFIVEGSVRRMGDRVRITAQLIDAEAGNHVWAEKYDRALSELFAVQDEVVRTIVGTLVGRVQARDAARARRKPPSSLAAYECVLKGNALPWAEPEGFAEATRLFEQAIALDPEYGLAHALLAAMRYGQWYDDPVGRRRSAGRGVRAGYARRRTRSGREHLPLPACPGSSPARRVRSVPAAHATRGGAQSRNQWNWPTWG